MKAPSRSKRRRPNSTFSTKKANANWSASPIPTTRHLIAFRSRESRNPTATMAAMPSNPVKRDNPGPATGTPVAAVSATACCTSARLAIPSMVMQGPRSGKGVHGPVGPGAAEFGVRQPVLAGGGGAAHEPRVAVQGHGDPPVKIAPERVARDALHRAGLQVAGEVDLHQRPAVADVRLEGGVLHQVGAVADPVGAAG